MKNILDHEIAHQKYFEEMTRIPHGSYHEEAYSDYLEVFAKEHNLSYKRDTMNSVIIYKPASTGYENHEPVILQAHTDMVCEKNNDTEFDFSKDPLQLYIEDGFLKAKGTTLGADDGVGVAYMLALLADREAKHPPLECAFTVQEEVGLYGAMALDPKDFKGKRLINLDDGGETSTCTTSAGGMNVIFTKECILIPTDIPGYTIAISGLKGGHSGGEIDKERGNANKLLARALYGMKERLGLQLANFNGGIKDNAIPREAVACFVSDAAEEAIEAYVKDLEKVFKEELAFSDAGVTLTLTPCTIDKALSIEDTEDICNLLMTLPNGLRHHSMKIEGLSTASSNIGVVHTSENAITINCSLRGAMESYVDTLAMEMDCLAAAFNFTTTHEARYPAWSYREDSPMRSVMQEVCQKLYGRELELVAVHGGLECGVFKAMDEDMDIVTMGPKMQDIHTPQEALDLASFDGCFHFLKEFLEAL